MPMELQGFDNLRDDLTNMASNLEFGQGVNRALQEGAKPIEEQIPTLSCRSRQKWPIFR